MQDRIRTRLLTAGGTMLAIGGLAVATLAGNPALADTAQTEAQAQVGNVIELTANDASFTLSEVPGATATATSGLTAKSNNEAGYSITAQADAEELSGTGTNTDTIPVSDLKVENSDGAFTASSDTTAVTIHDQASKSAETGDGITANYEMAMPFVNADTYSVGLTFTAAAK